MASPLHIRRSSRPPLNILSLPGMQSTSQESVTTVLLSNLHCSSCVSTIKDALSGLVPQPKSVDVSIVTQTVTVRHSVEIFPQTIRAALDEVGFDIVSTPVDVVAPSSFGDTIRPIFSHKREKHLEQCVQCQVEHSPSHNHASTTVYVETSSSTPLHLILSVGGMTCASCSNTITDALRELSGVSDVAVNLLGHSASVTVDCPDLIKSVVTTIQDIGYEAEIISAHPNPKRAENVTQATCSSLLRLTLSVGGMTCASCTNTVTETMSGVPGVSQPTVNLLGNSATAFVTSEKVAALVVESIEDIGYDAHIVSLEFVDGEDKGSEERTITLCVDGMFCHHCPARIMAALQPFSPNVTVLQPLTTHTDSLLRISYRPEPPIFTIRTIIDAIAAVPLNSEAGPGHFTAAIHHPPSLEDRARRMQARDQHALLSRLLFSFIVAIPTFIIGVVYMSLVPSSNHIRMWFMQPIWAGNASRLEWAMLLLSTPVMFYSAGIFHRRSLKEIYALWRKGSRTPIWKRFIRFGSMNLLVSAGVSVAYFASIALLALAAVDHPSHSGEGDSTTYFDSVVFLTMFLLAGRYLEAYSKGRTASAIGALGKLRPATALLLTADVISGTSSPTIPESRVDVDLEKGPQVVGDLGPVKPGTRIQSILAELLEVGDIVRVPHGASPPADGVVVSGAGGAFDESSLTGESRLVKKNVGDQVFVATVNKGAVVDVRVEAIGGQTMLDHVVKVVQEGQTRRAPIERVADLLTGYFVPVITLLAILTWIIWLSLGLSGVLPRDYLDTNIGGWPVWSLEFAIAVFVVACPCGIGLAAPTALLVGSGLAAKFGVLVRGGGEAFQEAAQLDLIVFDKTGTLTQGGEPQVTDTKIFINRTESVNDDQPMDPVLLGIAAELEAASSHPLGIAIRQYCEQHQAVLQHASGIAEVAGRGITADFEALSLTAIVGNEAWMQHHDCPLDGRVVSTLDFWKQQGKSIVLLATKDSTGTGGAGNTDHASGHFAVRLAFAISDPLRSEAQVVVRCLQGQGVHTWMISGDNEVTAKAVARMVGIPDTNVIAGVLPHEKAEKIQWLQQVGMKRSISKWRQRLTGTRRLNSRCIVAMVGDGINDAPALTAADVSIAIGSGSDVALSSASFILVSSNLKGLLTLVDLSRTVFNRVKFNFLWATIYNVIAVPIAAGVVYPAGHARLAPVWASLAMALSSVSVVCSSLLLKLYKEPRGN
ncbi:heavy metal translocatin [Cristinia sonorae]|uniref:Heavy metal translocatin n=1 Tax=Cristinia sonorae TaxID=1940300 RepID=A0A8K0UWX7_9AGAR|nr:heavy metal translocatin [Cristinia sonorae]